jgi:hypothetical protein
MAATIAGPVSYLIETEMSQICGTGHLPMSRPGRGYECPGKGEAVWSYAQLLIATSLLAVFRDFRGHCRI